MQILIVGDWSYSIYEQALSESLKKIGCSVNSFNISKYFKSRSLLKRLENRYSIGGTIKAVNRDLSKSLTNEAYDVVFFYRVRHVNSELVKNYKSINPNTKFVYYNNDDPFSINYQASYWKKSIELSKCCDLIYSYRYKNITDFKRVTSNKTIKLLPPSYVKSKDVLSKQEVKIYDAIFVGHYENDGRDQTINFLQKNNINILVCGTGWNDSPLRADIENVQGRPIAPVYGALYNKTLASSYFALIFLSKLNNDTFTRRNYEIPAAKTIPITENVSLSRKNNLPILNQEDYYFSNKEELLYILRSKLENKQALLKECNQYFDRLVSNENEITDRAKQLIHDVNELRI